MQLARISDLLVTGLGHVPSRSSIVILKRPEGGWTPPTVCPPTRENFLPSWPGPYGPVSPLARSSTRLSSSALSLHVFEVHRVLKLLDFSASFGRMVAIASH